jgi:23S rRNA (cytidine1920-2'-O)/16S rRNA (cytidine1409-2'-O)-methyltransferase
VTQRGTGKVRIDQLLVERNLVDSRQKAQAMILAGWVTVDGRKVEKAGAQVDTGCRIDLLERLPYVSRGGVKLAAALDAFAIDVAGRVCLDVGASTGGFTDCLLQRGAARVYAVDTGAGQLDWKLRNDPRVILREHTNARYLTTAEVPEPVAVATLDVSFISVTMIVPAVAPLLDAATGAMVILVKPQFEVGRSDVGKGGIVRDPALHQAACLKVREAVVGIGFDTRLMESPITGVEGNREFLLYAHR